MADVTKFDYPYDIERIAITRGSYDQSTGEWQDETTSTSTLTGNFSPSPLVTESRGRVDSYEEGEARLFTNDSLEVGDRVRVYHDSDKTSSTDYRVEGIVDDYGFISNMASSMPALDTVNARREYKLVRLGD